MEVSTVNDVKIYNLSAGKSVPEWLSSEARRKLEKKNVDARRRIQLIQDFDMPDVSHSVTISPDGRYVFASGDYKPFLKCYDLSNLSLKFERGLDSEVIKTICLSEDYSKVIILEQERYIEMHAAFGRYFRMRMPCFGRDMAYSVESSDLYLVGNKKEIYRLNLEQGEWLSPFESTGTALNCCTVSNEHQLLMCGTTSGIAEAWDHRDKTLCGMLDCSAAVSNFLGEDVKAEVTSIAYADALHIGVGTSTGHVLLYDIRSRRPILIKDHNNELPIKKIDFVKRDEGDVVLSMDSRMLKMWHSEDGQPLAAIENQFALNDFARFPGSGLFFFANEAPRMLQYFVPSIGPAPKWCSYLEGLTEEMEEAENSVYDNYKFVTKKQLEELGLSGLEGTNLLRAYMHGYFIDARLYAKAQTRTQPFAYDQYKANKIKEMVEEERDQKTIKKKKEKLPEVNAMLAQRLREESTIEKKKADNKKEKKQQKRADVATTLLADDRFKKLFESTDFEVDETSEQFERNMALSQKLKERRKEAKVSDDESEDEEEEDVEASGSEDDDHSDVDTSKINARPVWLDDDEVGAGDDDMASDLESDGGQSSDDDDVKRKKAKDKQKRKDEVQKRRLEKLENRKIERQLVKDQRQASKPTKFVLHSIGAGETTRKFVDEKVVDVADDSNEDSLALGQRKRVETRKSGKSTNEAGDESTPFGGRQMSFKVDKRGADLKKQKDKEKKAAHREERAAVSRRPNALVTKGLKKLPGNLNLGKNKFGG